MTLETALSAPRPGRHELVPIFNSIAILHSDWFRHYSIINFRTSTIFTSHMLISCANEQKAQQSCIIHWWALSIGVATMANKKALFVTLVDRTSRFDAYWSHFFAEFDWFVVLTSRLDAYISRYGDFCANDDDDDDTTDYFTPCACAQGNDTQFHNVPSNKNIYMYSL